MSTISDNPIAMSTPSAQVVFSKCLTPLKWLGLLRVVANSGDKVGNIHDELRMSCVRKQESDQRQIIIWEAFTWKTADLWIY